MNTYFSKPEKTNNENVWIVGRRYGQSENFTGYIYHFGSFDGAKESLKNSKAA